MKQFSLLWGYGLFRIIVGFILFIHGSQKLFGIVGGTAQDFGTLMWFVGLGELLVGLSLALGILVRIGALGGLIIMTGAIYRVHMSIFTEFDITGAGNGRVLLMFFALLMFAAHGAQALYLERVITKKKTELV